VLLMFNAALSHPVADGIDPAPFTWASIRNK